MKITIDTKEDSHEDIRKIVNILSEILGNKQPSSNVFESSSSEMPGLMGMFNQPSQPQPASTPEPVPEKKERTSIQFY